MAIKTEAPKYTAELLAACEHTLSNHNLRCKVGIDIGTVLDTLTANGVTAEAAFGQLALTQNGTPAHSAVLMEALAKQRTELFFPRTTEAVTSRDQLDRQGKVEYIRTHTEQEWRDLPQTAATDQVVVLDPARMTKKQWLSLDRKTRVDLSGQWGEKIVGSIMAR